VTRRMPAEDFSLEEFDRIQSTNARGSWCASMLFGSQMLKAGLGGCIINVDSFVTASLLKHVLPYSMSKGAIQALTKGLALEWGPRGIRVNGIAPGLILTPISEALWKQPHMQQWALDQTPLQRMGDVEDLVGAAIFLASPAASFMTGQTLRVDGGLSAGRHWPITGSLVANPFEKAEHVIHNGRVEQDLVQQQHGSAVRDFHDEAEVRAKYYPELLDLAGRLLGTYKVIVASHVLRRVDSPAAASTANSNDDNNNNNNNNDNNNNNNKNNNNDNNNNNNNNNDNNNTNNNIAGQGNTGVRSGAFMAHGDFADSFKDQLQAMLADGQPCIVGQGGLGLSAEELQQGRLV
ncbi:unnamed protein product, partial [Polarella glacialis]